MVVPTATLDGPSRRSWIAGRLRLALLKTAKRPLIRSVATYSATQRTLVDDLDQRSLGGVLRWCGPFGAPLLHSRIGVEPTARLADEASVVIGWFAHHATE